MAQLNGPSTGFDFRSMQEAMIRKRVSFRDLAKVTQIPVGKLRRIACGFALPGPLERRVIEDNLKKDGIDG